MPAVRVAGEFLDLAPLQCRYVPDAGGRQATHGCWEVDDAALRSHAKECLGPQFAALSLQAKVAPPPSYGGGCQAESVEPGTSFVLDGRRFHQEDDAHQKDGAQALGDAEVFGALQAGSFGKAKGCREETQVRRKGSWVLRDHW